MDNYCRGGDSEGTLQVSDKITPKNIFRQKFGKLNTVLIFEA